MNLSFYNGALGARMQQEKLNVIGNNVANVNTEGFKSKNPVFSNLMYMNMNAGENANTRLRAGAGVRLEKTDTNMEAGTLIETGNPLNFTIAGEGLFALRNPADNSTLYTRNGSFIRSERADGEFYLATNEGHLVLGKDNNPIKVLERAEEDFGEEDFGDEGDFGDEEAAPGEPPLKDRIAVFRFDNYNDMTNVGSNKFIPVEKNGYPVLDRQAQLMEGTLESSNVDFAQEMVRMLETQRAYQYAIRMITTSDEIEGTINSLRG